MRVHLCTILERERIINSALTHARNKLVCAPHRRTGKTHTATQSTSNRHLNVYYSLEVNDDHIMSVGGGVFECHGYCAMMANCDVRVFVFTWSQRRRPMQFALSVNECHALFDVRFCAPDTQLENRPVADVKCDCERFVISGSISIQRIMFFFGGSDPSYSELWYLQTLFPCSSFTS